MPTFPFSDQQLEFGFNEPGQTIPRFNVCDYQMDWNDIMNMTLYGEEGSCVDPEFGKSTDPA